MRWLLGPAAVVAPGGTGWQACSAFKATSVPTVSPPWRKLCRRGPALSLPTLIRCPALPRLCAHRGGSGFSLPEKGWDRKSPHHPTGTGSLSVRGFSLVSLPPAAQSRGAPISQQKRLRPGEVGALSQPEENPGLTPEPTPTAFRVSELGHAPCSLALAPKTEVVKD